jgi:mono/diheme cytochrome c family protein
MPLRAVRTSVLACSLVLVAVSVAHATTPAQVPAAPPTSAPETPRPKQPAGRVPPKQPVDPVAAKANGDSVVLTKRPPDVDVGRRLWQQSCWQCHGKAGAGDGPAAKALPAGVPPLTGKVKEAGFDAMVRIIQDGKGRMPAYAETIDKHDSRRILVYLQERMEGRVGDAPAASGAKDDKDEGGEAN